jgi:hypothetical protein
MSAPAAAPDPYHFSKMAEEMIAAFRGLPHSTGRSQPRVTQPLSALMPALLDRYGLDRDRPEDALRDRWTELVGPAAAYSHPARIENGRLLVLVSHPVVRTELQHHRAIVLERIRAVPGCELIRELNCRIG